MAAKQVPGPFMTTEEIEFHPDPQPADADGKAEAEAVEPESIEPETKGRTYPEGEMGLWKFINGVFYQLGQDCPIFGILVIGETGTGKSTLINNLLGHEAAAVGHSMESETQFVTPHERSVEGVPVVVYDTPGLGDTSGDDDPKHLEIMKSLLDRKKIHLVVYCVKLTENRMRGGLIRTFQEYHQSGVPWKQTVVALTFADKEEDTTGKFSMMQQQLKKTLIKRVRVTSSIVDELKICPTAKDPTEALPNGKQWYVPFWLDVVGVLVPAALVQFLFIHKNNIHMEGMPASKHPTTVNITLVGEDQKRFQREVDRLPTLRARMIARREMELAGSSEAGVIGRDPLSQPVHCCKRYAVLFRKHVSRQGAGKGKAILECLGLTREQIKLCYQSNPLNEEEAIQDGLHKWQETQGDHCTWQVLLEAMKFAGVSEQHRSQLVQEVYQWKQSTVITRRDLTESVRRGKAFYHQVQKMQSALLSDMHLDANLLAKLNERGLLTPEEYNDINAHILGNIPYNIRAAGTHFVYSVVIRWPYGVYEGNVCKLIEALESHSDQGNNHLARKLRESFSECALDFPCAGDGTDTH